MQHILTLAQDIKLLILDVDGVLTDGRLYFTPDGQELKVFNTLDGHGIKQLQKSGVAVAIITGRQSPAVEKRARDLGIAHCYQGQENKRIPFEDLLNKLTLSLSEIAYAGDDLPDLPIMQKVGLSIAVANAHATVIKHAHMTTQARGGEGAVREICDLIMHAQNTLSSNEDGYLS